MLENAPFNPERFHERDPSTFRGRALHAVGWNELTARINAARDLRELLKQDLVLGTASFTDAAAGYFVPSDQGKPDVNHNVLGHCKSLDDNRSSTQNASGADLQEGSQEQGCRENK